MLRIGWRKYLLDSLIELMLVAVGCSGRVEHFLEKARICSPLYFLRSLLVLMLRMVDEFVELVCTGPLVLGHDISVRC